MSVETFVEQLYRDFLFRASDDEGKAYWVGKLARGEESAAQITSSFAQSDEYSSRAKSVSELYFLLFERVPDSEGMQYWLDEVDKGLSIDALVEMFMASDEYASKYAGVNDDGFLTQLVEQGTGQSVDGDEKAVFSEQLTTGGRAGLIRYIADTPSFEQQHGDAIQVTSLYQGVLSRAPSAEELRSATTSSITLIDELYSRSDYVGEVVPQVGESTASNSSSLSNLVQTQGITINGPSNYLFIGDQVSEAGDVNGDGFDDFLVKGRTDAYLVFGHADLAAQGIDLSNLNGQNGIVLEGDFSGVSAVGDINGDGFDDIVVRNSYADSEANAYLLFGQNGQWQSSIAPFEQSDSEQRHSSVVFSTSLDNGVHSNDLYVLGVGDINGDAVDDLLFTSGNPLQAGDTQTEKRVINLLYGKKDGWDASVDLATLDSTQGAIIITPRISAHTNGNEYGLAESVGDINNDGIVDLALLNLYGDDGCVRNLTLLYGQSSDWDAQLILDGSSSPAITEITTAAHEQFEEVRSVGDFNGDGIADLMFRMSGSTENQIGGIVFGREDNYLPSFSIDVLNGSNGIALYDSSGDPTDSAFRVVSIEDLNNDGFSDVLVNKTEVGGDGLTDNLYVVYGYASQTGDTIDLASLTETQGLLLTKYNGADNGYIYSAAGVGDVNGDGYSDFLAGNQSVDLPGIPAAGQAYLIFGGDQLLS